MNKSYKIRIYPNQKQKEQINITMGCSRFIYNQMLAERIEVYERLKDNKEELYSYKYKTEKEYKKEFEWLKNASSWALTQSRIDLETAYKNFYRELKKGNIQYPKFKSKHKSRFSYRECQSGNQIRIKNNKIKFLKVGFVKLAYLSNNFDGIIKSITVSKSKTNKYYVSILTEQEQYIKKRIFDNKIGLDLGLTDFCITSDGKFFKPIRENLNKLDKKKKYWQKKFSRQLKGSKRREKTRLKIAKIYERQNNLLNYFQWHLVNKLCSENQTISLETLRVKNMMKNRKLARVIGQASWSSFILKLQSKAKEYETELLFQDSFFASTKTCYRCGFKNNAITLKDRIFICPNCNYEQQRDLNAALNLEKISSVFGDYKHREEIRPMKVIFNFGGTFDEVFIKET